ncbi:phage holin family protein [Streptomyces lanatus]|uniref:Phage holin family protein n=1 Tax=Streptomyces lanatus TaxID=66900 RepID=A0ABV1XPM3_9ACTN|nr:phage holin family protein [Streptomyces lanatus]GHG87350.1 hypothetical protein GCM10018780_04800 [Streptomyces lanatus]
MDRLDHLEHLDKQLVDELAQVARETVRDELRRQRRRAVLYAGSGALALYAGAALALALGLGLAVGLPDWAAALITAVILGAVAYLLRGAARPTTDAAETTPGRTLGGTAPSAPPGGLGLPYPPMPPGPPEAGAPDTAGTWTPHPDDIDPEQPHHRA